MIWATGDAWNLPSEGIGVGSFLAGQSSRRGQCAGTGPFLISCTRVGMHVTMANEVARLNKPTAFSGAEEEYSDWEFARTCFVGTMDGTLLTELQAVASDPKGEANPDRPRGTRGRERYC